jgi:cytochrome c oxidase subunit 2
VATGVVATVLILFVLLVYSVFTGRAIATPPDDTEALTIEVIGHQFWWEVQYLAPVPSERVTTAHEIHIPVGQPVRIQVQTRDVIHSFWVPNLHGKVDLIPGQVNTIWLQADTPGVFRGQCAEFCGLQHALMGFLVIAQPPAEFAAWLEHQRQPAALPTDPAVARGQEVFLSAPCMLCHTVRGTGTGAMGQAAPDLTHFGSRRTIAAATLPNTRGNLAGWILDPQHIKPGNRMPAVHLAPADLQFLLDYLESLK